MSSAIQPGISDARLCYFGFDVHLPDETFETFWIAQDLAELFQKDLQAEAVGALTRDIERRDPSVLRRIDVDWESGCAFIHAARPDDILIAASAINSLCVPPHARPWDDAAERRVRALLRSWKRPRPARWGFGDVFVVPLCDGSEVHGQVVRVRNPTCALFDSRAVPPVTDVERIVRSRVLSILHLGPELLDKGVWRVIGNAPPAAAPDSGPHGDGHSVGSISFGGGDHLVDVAEAWYGLRPWNVGYCGDDDYFLRSLLPGVGRPLSAWILSAEERRRYREERGITG